MTAFRPKLWPAVGAVALILAGCSKSGEQGEQAPAGGETPASAAGEAGETAAGEGGAGEAGAADAYASVPAASRTALRIAHLKGFFLIAQEVQKSEGDDAAAALAGQGMLEVFDPVADIFRTAGVDEARLREAATKGDAASLKAAIANLDSVRAKAGGDAAAVVSGLTGIAAGLYGHVITDGAVDPIEYQHSRGAALSARADLDRFAGANPKVASARGDIVEFLKFWPAVSAPEDVAKVTPAAKVQAQASRIQLALS
jgi:hypothetical protein